jgi:ADP-ribosylglycohydrolase
LRYICYRYYIIVLIELFGNGENMLDRVRGTILGTAIGDALGMPVESFKPDKIKELYGKIIGLEEPRDENPYHKLHKGQWTDDTQLMIVIAESLVSKKCIDYDDIAAGHVKKLYDPRGWGKATTQSVERIKNGIKWWASGEPGATGNGPPMKIAPIGVLYGLKAIDKSELFTVVLNISRMTHKDSRAAAAGILQAWLVGKAIQGGVKGLRFALNDLSSYECWHYETALGISDRPLHSRFSNENSGIVEASFWSDEEIRSTFGTSAFVNQSIPFTYAMVLKYLNNPSEGLISIINQGGDADTTGAMAGALFGAAYGTNIFPNEFINFLEDREKIIKLAESLYYTFKP